MEQFKQILANKTFVIGAIVTALVAIMLVIIVGTINLSHSGSTPKEIDGEEIKEDVNLLTTDNLGKALEIQALLTKHGINAIRTENGTKSVLVLSKKKGCAVGKKKCTVKERDLAIMTIVESGLYDQNVGLEIFDKGDFTSTKEDKRIR